MSSPSVDNIYYPVDELELEILRLQHERRQQRRQQKQQQTSA
jgi:hypothetical protein